MRGYLLYGAAGKVYDRYIKSSKEGSMSTTTHFAVVANQGVSVTPACKSRAKDPQYAYAADVTCATCAKTAVVRQVVEGAEKMEKDSAKSEAPKTRKASKVRTTSSSRVGSPEPATEPKRKRKPATTPKPASKPVASPQCVTCQKELKPRAAKRAEAAGGNCGACKRAAAKSAT